MKKVLKIIFIVLIGLFALQWIVMDMMANAELDELVIKVHPVINNILKRILMIESELIQKYNFSFVTSIILLAVPKENDQ